MLIALALASAAYGPMTDKLTGAQCPAVKPGSDLYDMSLYGADDVMNTPPAVITRCIKQRQALLDKRASRKSRR